MGRNYNDAEMGTEISKHHNVGRIDLSGQTSIGHETATALLTMPNLWNLELTGSIRVIDWAGITIMTEQLNAMPIPPEFLDTLTQKQLNIRELSLNASLIDDDQLAKLSLQLPQLETIYLTACQNITDKGLISLLNNAPHLKQITLGSWSLRDYYVYTQHTIGPSISPELIEQIRQSGIEVYE